MTDPFSGADLFAYGTLMAPEVLEAATGRAFAAEPAVLEGYRRVALRGRVYPGILAAEGASVEGLLIRAVDPVSMSLLDRFESVEYDRLQVRVRLADGAWLSAQTYVWADRLRGEVVEQPWDYAEFRRRHLADWIARVD